MAILRALYDANVLYPAPLRDLLMHLAQSGLFHARWTDAIHDEWTRNLLANRTDLTAERLAKTRALMNAAVLDCLVTGYEELIPGLTLPDDGDRHVLAAAIRGGCEVIVTFNLKDFPRSALAPFGVETQHPDDFILNLLDLDAGRVYAAVKRQRESLRKPTKTAEELLATLFQQGLVQTVTHLQNVCDLL